MNTRGNFSTKTRPTFVRRGSFTMGLLSATAIGACMACSGETGSPMPNPDTAVGEGMNSSIEFSSGTAREPTAEPSSPGSGQAPQAMGAEATDPAMAAPTQGLAEPIPVSENDAELVPDGAAGAGPATADDEEQDPDPQGGVLNGEADATDSSDADGSLPSDADTSLTPIEDAMTQGGAGGEGGDDTEPQDVMTPAGDEGVADLEACQAVSDWDPQWVQFEDEVLLLTNEERAKGATCGTYGSFEPAGPLSADSVLRCAARLHSLDMYERDFFDHYNPDGDGPGERLAALNYDGGGWGENIAAGQATPQDVVDAWMKSDGHCSNIMESSFEFLGVGYHAGAGRVGIGSNYWTQNFGAPPFMFGGFPGTN
jgi:uncharacterized protein YkwD